MTVRFDPGYIRSRREINKANGGDKKAKLEQAISGRIEKSQNQSDAAKKLLFSMMSRLSNSLEGRGKVSPERALHLFRHAEVAVGKPDFPEMSSKVLARVKVDGLSDQFSKFNAAVGDSNYEDIKKSASAISDTLKTFLSKKAGSLGDKQLTRVMLLQEFFQQVAEVAKPSTPEAAQRREDFLAFFRGESNNSGRSTPSSLGSTGSLVDNPVFEGRPPNTNDTQQSLSEVERRAVDVQPISLPSNAAPGVQLIGRSRLVSEADTGVSSDAAVKMTQATGLSLVPLDDHFSYAMMGTGQAAKELSINGDYVLHLADDGRGVAITYKHEGDVYTVGLDRQDGFGVKGSGESSGEGKLDSMSALVQNLSMVLTRNVTPETL